MTAQPSDPPSWYYDLERRLTSLEGEQAHVWPHEMAATREAVRLVHGNLGDVSQQVTRIGQKLDQVAAEVDTVGRSQIEHGAALATLAGGVASLTATVDRHGVVLAGLAAASEGHGVALREILRRLPAPPAGQS